MFHMDINSLPTGLSGRDGAPYQIFLILKADDVPGHLPGISGSNPAEGKGKVCDPCSG